MYDTGRMYLEHTEFLCRQAPEVSNAARVKYPDDHEWWMGCFASDLLQIITLEMTPLDRGQQSNQAQTHKRRGRMTILFRSMKKRKTS